ncbi:MAG: transglutaminase domain-containing protein [Bacteroidota bacterium]
MKQKLFLTFVFSFFAIVLAFGQDKLKIKFGSVTADDFKTKIYPLDSNAAAIVLADIGSTEIIGNTKGNFSLLFKNYRRAHILNKNGYGIGDVEIPLYTNGSAEEELENLKAVTYNLENGKVVETKLDVKTAVFKDKINKNLVVKKFTFPNIKEGSIIEYEYKVNSDFITNLQPWEFQGEYPRLWSEYNVAQPSFYNYVTLTQGYVPYYIKNQSTSIGNFSLSDQRGAEATQRTSFTDNVTDFRWVMKDVPALKEENFTSTLRNHIARIEFQLKSVGPPFTPRQVMSSWDVVAKELLESEDFGAQLKRDNGWLNDVMPLATRNAGSSLDKAKNIYAWVRDNFTCTNYNRKYLEQPLKTILKNKNGNLAEINLLLVAMLRKANIPADPVLLSTRSHGYSHSIYPLMDRMNYVICRIEPDGNAIFLDASEPGMGFGKLGYKCYNGSARIITAAAPAINLDAGSLREVKSTMVFIINDDKGNSIGTVQQVPGYFESSRLRNLVKEKGKEQLFTEIKKDYPGEILISKTTIDSLDKYDEPLAITYDIDLKAEKEDILYINPMFGEGFKENPFKAAERFYPVEMPYTSDNTYNLQMEIPKGYAIDELPKGAIIKFNDEEDAIFEYRVSVSGGNISFRSRLLIKKAFFEPDEYETLRDFFAMIVKKQSEQIVFKKKANQ